ncbi:MAG: hypothetical protein AMS27_12555 [Bacteroides sp. SM23_62_1]|nr:MAG: hypothetical protein AMS27_12555 [Bacteroides sp. SM23_62_1]
MAGKLEIPKIENRTISEAKRKKLSMSGWWVASKQSRESKIENRKSKQNRESKVETESRIESRDLDNF